MKINPNLFNDFHDLKCWKIYSQKSFHEARLYSKELNHIDFSGRYFLDIDFVGVSYQVPRMIRFIKLYNKFARGLLKPLIFLFAYLYRVTLSKRNASSRKNKKNFQATKP
ncbi:hypothetical protein OAW71_02430 [Methylophilaceae bacterium]|nr:hypothetical protein [Methylophilaceae bacterium]